MRRQGRGRRAPRRGHPAWRSRSTRGCWSPSIGADVGRALAICV